MTREDMIRMLVDYSVAAAAADPQASWLRDIFTTGIRGFATMSSADLLRELQYRALAGFEDPLEDEDLEDEVEEPRIENLIGSNHSRNSEDAERE